MQITKEEILERISSMTLIEIVELIDAMEKKFGIDSSSISVDLNKNNESLNKDNNKKTEFNLYLNSIGNNKISVIKIIRSYLNLGLKDAKDLVESCPVLIKEKVNLKDLELIKKSLEEVGAVIEIK